MTTSRRQFALNSIERALLRDSPNLSDGALNYLMADAANLIEVASYEAGDGLDVTSAIAALKRSEIGRMIYSADQSDDTTDPKAAQRAALAQLSGAERLSYARKHGLA